MSLDLAVLAGLFLTGLAGSLHCVGMCGPILLGFARALEPAGERRGGLGWGFAQYHVGRLWTYALLGFAAAWAGAELRHGALAFGWQQPLALLLSAAVIVFGLLGMGWIPGPRLDLGVACVSNEGAPTWAAFLRTPRPGSRLLLGAVMGLLPCGLVYAALLVAATLPHPLLGALGMLCFGFGTLPALTALMAGSRWLPLRLRLASRRLPAAVLLIVGCFMLARSLGLPMLLHGH